MPWISVNIYVACVVRLQRVPTTEHGPEHGVLHQGQRPPSHLDRTLPANIQVYRIARLGILVRHERRIALKLLHAPFQLRPAVLHIVIYV